MKEFADFTGGVPESNGADALLASFRENESALVRFITSRVGCRATAQDIVQEVFLRLLPPPSESIRDPRAFLFRIALNLASNHRAVTRRRTELVKEVKDLLWSGIDDTTPERTILAAEELRRVSSALSHLPERTCQILAWNRFEGLKQAEIANRLGISTSAVERHLRNALSALLKASEDNQK